MRLRQFFTAVAGEKGAAIVEAAIIAPALLFLAINIYDMTRLIMAHMVLTQVTREGVRYGSGVAYLAPGWYVWRETDNTFWCGPGWPPDSGTNCTLLPPDLGARDIAINTMALVRFHMVELSLIPADTKLYIKVDVTSQPDNLTIWVQTKYRGTFKLFSNMRINARGIGPYVT